MRHYIKVLDVEVVAQIYCGGNNTGLVYKSYEMQLDIQTIQRYKEREGPFQVGRGSHSPGFYLASGTGLGTAPYKQLLGGGGN